MDNEDEKYPKLELIVAADQNLGIGKDGKLPWHLPTEFAYFLRLTQNRDQGKVHVSIFGRLNWESVGRLTGPDGHPWKDTICFVLTRSPASSIQRLDTDELHICSTFQEIIDTLKRPDLRHRVDRVWVHGGQSVYKEALRSPHFHRLYWTKIHAVYPSDSFMPRVDEGKLRLVHDPDAPQGIQRDSGVEYQVCVYESSDPFCCPLVD